MLKLRGSRAEACVSTTKKARMKKKLFENMKVLFCSSNFFVQDEKTGEEVSKGQKLCDNSPRGFLQIVSIREHFSPGFELRRCPADGLKGKTIG